MSDSRERSCELLTLKVIYREITSFFKKVYVSQTSCKWKYINIAQGQESDLTSHGQIFAKRCQFV